MSAFYGNLWVKGFLLSESPPARKPLPRVRKPNLHSDRKQDSSPVPLETPRTLKHAWFHCSRPVFEKVVVRARLWPIDWMCACAGIVDPVGIVVSINHESRTSNESPPYRLFLKKRITAKPVTDLRL
ncbi:hypothetical protein E2C01_033169 [Portunus trituberculatus]|uniref:Uncharacterized protein n=1 Tax=Portunus trituberculatus TaxID=210409 RepID=A0A5B7F4W0_PORTR|nr:hypothetical protein [Portunus trituberculatus]